MNRAPTLFCQWEGNISEPRYSQVVAGLGVVEESRHVASSVHENRRPPERLREQTGPGR